MDDRESAMESRRECLHPRKREADAQRTDSQKFLDDLKQEKEDLEELTEDAEHDVDTNTRSAEDAFDKCLKFETHLITDAMIDKLPRELRDMVWSFCWADSLNKYNAYDDERPWRARGVPEDAVSGEACRIPGYDITLYKRAQAPGPYPIGHLADTEYMSLDAARESAEMFYKTAPAFVESLDDDAIKYYFCHDIFGLGLEPRKYITSIVFFLIRCEFEENLRGGYPSRHVDTLKLSEKSLQTIFGYRRGKLPRVVFRIPGNVNIALAMIPKAQRLFDQLTKIRAKIMVASDVGKMQARGLPVSK